MYKVNDIVIYDNWVSCKIVDVLNIDDGTMYRIEFLDNDNKISTILAAEYELSKSKQLEMDNIQE